MKKKKPQFLNKIKKKIATNKVLTAWLFGTFLAGLLFVYLPFSLAMGWLMSASFTGCAIPQAYKCYKEGHGKGLSSSFLMLWLIGELAGIIYSFNLVNQFGQKFWSWPLFANYFISTLLTLFIMRYHFIPKAKWEKLSKTLREI